MCSMTLGWWLFKSDMSLLWSVNWWSDYNVSLQNPLEKKTRNLNHGDFRNSIPNPIINHSRVVLGFHFFSLEIIPRSTYKNVLFTGTSLQNLNMEPAKIIIKKKILFQKPLSTSPQFLCRTWMIYSRRPSSSLSRQFSRNPVTRKSPIFAACVFCGFLCFFHEFNGRFFLGN